mmetsp:Transcript_19794/g.27865  ORF Transcript_19794/g.27865 Transcript_19794/m.27865 type:complete len:94 (+) Transcript_19794:116-397(+)
MNRLQKLAGVASAAHAPHARTIATGAGVVSRAGNTDKNACTGATNAMSASRATRLVKRDRLVRKVAMNALLVSHVEERVASARQIATTLASPL